MAAKFLLGAMLTHFSFHTISFFALRILSRYNIFKSTSQMVFLRCNMIACFQIDCRHARCTSNKLAVFEIVSYHLDRPPILNRGISLSTLTKVKVIHILSLVTGPSKRGNKNPKDFLDRGPGETEFKLVGNPL